MNTIIRVNRPFAHRGASLLEVLVVILVLGVGMLSMAKIHALILRDGGSANNRAIAMTLAQHKIDELRGFKCPLGGAGGCTLTGGETDFNSIVAGNDGSAITTLGGTALVESYNRSWTMTNWYLCLDADDADGDGNSTESLTTNTNCGKSYPDYKTIIVTVTWTDSNGAQSVSLTTSIYATDAYSMAEASGGAGSSFPGPQVGYTPIGVPDSVPVSIGDSSSKESSQATPKVTQGGDTTAVFFDQTSYTTGGTALSQDEWATISCVCNFGGSGSGMTPTREVWNHTTQKLEIELGVSTTKTVGTSNPTGSINTLEEQLCADCCRDHHDTSGTTYPKYDPVRYTADPSGNFEANGDHKHYRDADNDGTIESGESFTTGEYLESCRFRRVNGLYRLYQDWRMVDFTVMPRDGYLDVDATDYLAYLDTALAYFGLNNGPAPDKADLPGRNFIELILGQQAQVLGRALYIDTIYNCRHDTSNPGHCASGSDPTTANSTHISDVGAIKTAGGSWKKGIPFAEVNLTLFAHWTSDQSTRVSVTDQTVDSIIDPINNYYGTYSRGRVVGGTSTGAAVITALTRRGNTSLTSGVTTAELPIDIPDLNETLSDNITVTRVAGGADGTITGSFTRGDAQATTSLANNDIRKTNTTGVTCTATTGLGFSCTVPSGWSGNIWFVQNPHEFYRCVGGVRTEITEAAPLQFSSIASGSTNSVAGLMTCMGACTTPCPKL